MKKGAKETTKTARSKEAKREKSARDKFLKQRGSFVKAYEKYRDTDPEEKPLGSSYIIKEIGLMLKHVKSWKWLQQKKGVPACFEQKCDLIIAAAKALSEELRQEDKELGPGHEEIYEMIAVHIGALDIDGYTADDEFAVEWAKESEEMHKDWHTMPFLREGNRKYLFDIWNDLHSKFDGCGCRLCIYCYSKVPPPPPKWSSRTPTPQNEPKPSSSSSSTTSSSEE
ncbi:hypothetical protein N7492_010431 [Penicillium capsulatum]|uniref:Uncharacterized protein n=1 Tax=Penicillium capsulatum TaxID=69766 RepID=A0A9W9LDW0_9EURO|nr:hypothetical protein N7492_010431 [Penicillium capsulatum]KAJ6112935.1 hypothetical protein N7512_008259 [Penicillium capsulatum]